MTDADRYRNAKSTRPLWANALIITLVALVAALLAGLMGAEIPAWLLLAVAFVAAAVAGVSALVNVSSRK